MPQMRINLNTTDKLTDELRKKEQEAAIKKILAQEKLDTTKQLTDTVEPVLLGLQQQQQQAPAQKPKKEAAPAPAPAQAPAPAAAAAPAPAPSGGTPTAAGFTIPTAIPGRPAEELDSRSDAVLQHGLNRPRTQSVITPKMKQGAASALDTLSVLPKEEEIPQVDTLEVPEVVDRSDLHQNALDLVKDDLPPINEDKVADIIDKMKTEPDKLTDDELIAAAVITFAPTVLSGLFSGGGLQAMIGGAKAGKQGLDVFLSTKAKEKKTKKDLLKTKADLIIKNRDSITKRQTAFLKAQTDKQKLALVSRRLGIAHKRLAFDVNNALLRNGVQEERLKDADLLLDKNYLQNWLKQSANKLSKNRVLSDKAIEDFEAIVTVNEIISDLFVDIDEHKKEFGPGAVVNLNLPWGGKRVKIIDSKIRKLRQKVGKKWEGGVLRAEDERKYEAMLPKVTDLPSVFRAKLILLQNSWKRSAGMKLKMLQDKGVDIKPATDLGLEIIDLGEFSAGEGVPQTGGSRPPSTKEQAEKNKKANDALKKFQKGK